MSSRSILIVDDEQELANELSEFFDSSGWKVKVCFSGHEAVRELVHSVALSCVLTDLRIADFDGAELVTLAHKMPGGRRPLVLAIMTGHIVDQAEAADFGCDLLYVKPVDPDVVLADVERLLAHRTGAAASEG